MPDDRHPRRTSHFVVEIPLTHNNVGMAEVKGAGIVLTITVIEDLEGLEQTLKVSA